MIKRICDRCGKDITGEKYWGDIHVAMVNSAGKKRAYGPDNSGEYHYDLCPDCKLEFDNFMTEKKGFEKHDD